MKYDTSELSGGLLDIAVAVAMGLQYYTIQRVSPHTDNVTCWLSTVESRFSPSSLWEQGGPIIERHGITVGPAPKFNVPCKFNAFAAGDNQWPVMADTPLVAAMRCFVIAKMGAEVDL